MPFMTQSQEPYIVIPAIHIVIPAIQSKTAHTQEQVLKLHFLKGGPSKNLWMSVETAKLVEAIFYSLAEKQISLSCAIPLFFHQLISVFETPPGQGTLMTLDKLLNFFVSQFSSLVTRDT